MIEELLKKFLIVPYFGLYLKNDKIYKLNKEFKINNDIKDFKQLYEFLKNENKSLNISFDEYITEMLKIVDELPI